MAKENKLFNFYQKYMYLIGCGGHFIYILQALKILNNHSARDVSFLGFFISTLSVLSLLIYGAVTHDRVLFRVNLFGIMAALLCLIAIIIN